MADCMAGVVYGLNARTCDLIAAGQAYSQVRPALSAIDKIVHLRQSGTLRFRRGGLKESVLNEVPVEMWTMIRQGVIDEAREGARRKADKLVNDGHLAKVSPNLLSHLYEEAKESRLGHQKAKVWAAHWIDHTSGAGGCHSTLTAKDEWLTETAPEGLGNEPLTSLLATYSLYLPSSEPVTGTLASKLSSHTTSLAYQLRLPTGEVIQSTDTLDLRDEDPAEAEPATILDLPRSIFKVPADTDTKFARFMGEWHVTARVVSHRLTKTEGGRAGNSEVRKTYKRADAPRWMLVQKLYVDGGW